MLQFVPAGVPINVSFTVLFQFSAPAAAQRSWKNSIPLIGWNNLASPSHDSDWTNLRMKLLTVQSEDATARPETNQAAYQSDQLRILVRR